jgi:hypothetical protein
VLFQLRFRPLPQLLRQPCVPRIPTPTTLLSDGHIIRATLHLALWRNRRPRLRQRAALHARKMSRQPARNPSVNRPRDLHEDIGRHCHVQIREDDTGVYRHSGDFGIAFGERFRVEDVCEFGDAVAGPAVGGAEARLVEYDAARRSEVVPDARDVDDAHISPGLGGALECREQQLGEQGVTHVVGPELDFVALLCGHVVDGHDAGIVDEEIQPRFRRCECRSGGFDRGEGCQVEGEEDNVCSWDGRLNVGDGGVTFGGRAGGEVDLRGIVLGEVDDGLFT